MNRCTPIACAAALACLMPAVQAQTAAAAPAAPEAAASAPVTTLPTVNISASADASAAGLSKPYAGGQVARGGRAGILGTRDNMETPVSITSYTNDLIQDRQARSVGEVLQNDPGVRLARGFGNFQEAYFIRGFLLNSDDVAYNGLYSLLPRQYIATELFERVEVLRGASAFLSGANPSGTGIGGSINLLPKRATNEPLTRVTLSGGSGEQGNLAADVSRRFGPDNATGIRVNAAWRDGGTGIDDEKARTGLTAVGLDWHSRDVRLSGDIGYQDNQLKRTRTNVSLAADATAIPEAPDSKSNFAQPWSYSNERDLFGTLRGEWDLAADVTAWAAYGLRRSDESNSLANLSVTDASGAATTSRFDNTREDQVDTGELGVRGTLRTGPVGHEWVASYTAFRLVKKNAYAWDFFNTLDTNLYTPTAYAQPEFTAGAFRGNDLASPNETGRSKLSSFAIGDTLSMLDDTLLVTLGVRHQKLDISDYGYNTDPADDTRYDESRTSPMLGVVYKLGRQFSVYANHVEGLTQGNTLPGVNGGPPVTLEPYVSKQNEIGLKYDGGRFGASLALFATKKPRPVATQNSVTGEDRHQGVELSFFGEAMPGLKLLGGLTLLNAKQKDTGDATTEGRYVIGVPKSQGTVGAEWAVPGVEGLALDSRIVYTGNRFANSTNTLLLPSWTRVDLGARWLVNVQDRLVTLRARVDNVADKSYWASAGGYPENGYLVVGAPRTFVLSASVDF
jgi:iron complex outermembrane receptor protein